MITIPVVPGGTEVIIEDLRKAEIWTRDPFMYKYKQLC
jgi:hypothetical protein